MKFLKKNKGTVIIVGIVALLVLFTILVESNKAEGGNVEIDETLLSQELKDWTDITKTDEYVVTVIGLSYCDYCKQYKPIIEEVTSDENIKLYYFDYDTLAEANAEDAKALEYTYNLESYTGSSPYTFVTKNGEFLGDTVGAMDKDSTISFLQSLNAID